MYKNPINNLLYEVVEQAIDASTMDELIIYRCIQSNTVWSRSRKDFNKLCLITISNSFDFQYIKLIKHILDKGRDKSDRTKVGTRSITSYSFNIDISESFPLLTVKKTNYKSIFAELVWFLRGSTNSKNLNSTIWDANTTLEFLKGRGLDYDEGYLGPSYGYQWRGRTLYENEMQWEPTGKDQIQYLIDEINNNPDSRRILLSNWDVKNINKMALPPCHILFQIVVRDNYLDGIMYQRSADLFLGVPFNVASYSALLYIIASITNKKPGILTIHFGDVHIYSNHIEQATSLLVLPIYNSPTLELVGEFNINTISENNFNVVNYNCGPFIKGEMAV